MPTAPLPRPARRLISPTPLPQPVPPDRGQAQGGIRWLATAACLLAGWVALLLVLAPLALAMWMARWVLRLGRRA